MPNETHRASARYKNSPFFSSLLDHFSTQRHPSRAVFGERADMRLTAEQQARIFTEHGVCANEACDRCSKVLAEISWTRKDMPETYCSRLCRDGVERLMGRCDGCGIDLAGKRRGARWCSDTCRMRNRVKDSAN